MPSFAERSSEKELLDSESIPFADIRQNMQELNFINHHLGGHRITVKGISSLLDQHADYPLQVVEIGCGGGDNLKAIESWAARKKYLLQLTGVDINKACIAYAVSRSSNKRINFIQSDYREVQLPFKPDIIFSSLFCHHFTNEQLTVQLQWMQANSRFGFFINDLHRHPVAWWAIKSLTKAFSKSYLVKHDAPLSVLRSFTRKDWNNLFAAAGIGSYSCSWQWAFRWLVTYRHDTTT